VYKYVSSFLIGLGIGFCLCLIMLNLHAHHEIKKSENITLKKYWDGEMKGE